eukprot:332801-Amorphochlora_amoeboformis.AAC.1
MAVARQACSRGFQQLFGGFKTTRNMSHRQIRHITSGERFRSSAHRAERSGREISKWMEGEGCKVFVDCEQNSVDLESRFSVVDTDTTIDL